MSTHDRPSPQANDSRTRQILARFSAKRALLTFVAFMSLFCFSGSSANAQIDWTSDDGFWNDFSNWSSGVPGSNGAARFSGKSVDVTLEEDEEVGSLEFLNSNVLLQSDVVGTQRHLQLNNTGANLKLSGGSTVLTLEDVHLSTGLADDTTFRWATISDGATLNVGRNSKLSNQTNTLYVGDSGVGIINVTDGGRVDTLFSRLGYRSGSTGAAYISGPGSQWNTTNLSLGDTNVAGTTGSSNGLLSLSNSGKLIATGRINVGEINSNTSSTDAIGAIIITTNGDLQVNGNAGFANNLNLFNGSASLSSGGRGEIAGDTNLGFRDNEDGTFSTGGAGTLSVGSQAGGAAATWQTQNLNVATQGGTGAVSVENNAELTVQGSTNLGATGTLEIDSGGKLTTGSLTGVAGRSLQLGNGTLTINGQQNFSLAYVNVTNANQSHLVLRNGATSSAILLTDTLAKLTLNGEGTTLGNERETFDAKVIEVKIENGALLSSGRGEISNSARVDVSGANSRWENTSLYISDGTLNVVDGGSVFSDRSALEGFSFQPGTVTVAGTGSDWNSRILDVGPGGDGVLIVQRGGSVSSESATIGRQFDNGSAVVTISGEGSTWTNSSNLIVGAGGSGSLEVYGGGFVTSETAEVGELAGGSGSVTVSGAGSRWTNSSSLIVGAGGSGTLNVNNGGSVSNQAGVLGELEGSLGSVTVSGAESTWTNTDRLIVGSRGTGNLDINGGGSVSSESGSVGIGINAFGNVSVSGSDSTWTIADELSMGNFGNGSLGVIDGGSVTSNSSILGNVSGSSGVATVKGTDSTWTNTNELIVGRSGNGTLNVSDGGSVSSGTGSLGDFGSGSGSVTVSGAGSMLNNDGDLIVGSVGSGMLNVTNGGFVSNTTGVVGLQSGSTGSATIDGANSQWNNSGELFVGERDRGDGELNVTNGGVVSSGLGIIGYQAGSTGSVTIDGESSQWNSSGSLIIGQRGNGSLAVNDGGSVSSQTGALGEFDGSSGSVTVSGAGSTWTNATSLTVGDKGVGNLTIENEGVVSAGQASIGTNGSVALNDGLFTVSGQLSNTGQLNGRGSIQADGGIINNGLMDFSGGSIDIRGALINNSLIVTSENSATNFLDGLENQSEIQTDNGSFINIYGEFSGAGNFTGGGTVILEGSVNGGNGPAVVSFEGDLGLGNNSSALFELAGTGLGDFDRFEIGGGLGIFSRAELEVELIDGFELGNGQMFEIFEVAGDTFFGQFIGLSEGDLIGNFSGRDLFITYRGGDGNDVSLFTAVPEPSSALLVLAALFCGLTRRNRS